MTIELIWGWPEVILAWLLVLGMVINLVGGVNPYIATALFALSVWMLFEGGFWA